jgi:surface protein
MMIITLNTMIKMVQSRLLVFILFLTSLNSSSFAFQASQLFPSVLFTSNPIETKLKGNDQTLIGVLEFDDEVFDRAINGIGEEFVIVIDNEMIALEVDNIIKNDLGYVTLIGKRNDELYATFVLTYNREKIHGNFVNNSLGTSYEMFYNPEINANLISISHEGTPKPSLSEPLRVPSEKAKVTPKTSNIDLADPNDMSVAEIDVMVVFTGAAETWANENTGGIDLLASQAIAYAQSTVDNSNIYMTFNLVHTHKVNYSEADQSTDLNRVTGLDDGYMDEIHEIRNEKAADLVVYFSYGFDTGGVAWLLDDIRGWPHYGFSLIRINSAGIYTASHEMAHNMGSMHSRNQQSQTAPPEGGLFEYSTGWRWTGDDNLSYHSVMTYQENSNVRAPIFSSPDISYGGVPAGSYTGAYAPADNSRSLNEIRHVIANYRNKRVEGDFYLAANGVTIMCPTVSVGGTEIINGITYTKRSVNQINSDNAASTCTSGITDFSNLFFNEGTFNADISHWDLSDATTTYAMFYNATSFNQDVSAWDVSRVENFGYMFGGQSGMAFNSDISGWNTSTATDMEAMLQFAVDFNADISNWDVSNVTNMNYMLYGTTSFNQDISNWCVDKISGPPTSFSFNSGLSTDHLPVWGTCPNTSIRVVLSSPDNNSITDGVNIILDWESVESVGSYALQVSEDNFQTLLYDEIVNEHEYYVRLKSDQTYSWRVAAIVDQSVGNWSSSWSFTTPKSTIGFVSQKPISFTGFTGLITDSIHVDFSIGNLSIGDSLYSFEYEIDLSNTEIVQYDSISVKDLQGLIVEGHYENSQLRIAGISTRPIIDGEQLVRIHFSSRSVGEIQLKPDYVQLNNSIMNDVSASTIVITQLAFGDVDDDGDIDSFDAAAVLNYSVGTNLLSAIDPGVWESLRFAKADVDSDGLILAVDATHILHYIVGSADSLPMKSNTEESSIEVEWKDNQLHFSATDSIDGFNLVIPASTNYDTDTIVLNWETGISALNTSTDYKLGIASTKSVQGSFLQIPIVQIGEISETIELVMYAGNHKLVKKVELPGAVTIESNDVLPKEIVLEQNYPNPFNPTTQIQYALPMGTHVTLEVFNNVGQKVMELVNGQKSAGYHTATFDASGLSSGVYLYKLTSPSFTLTKKMLLIK